MVVFVECRAEQHFSDSEMGIIKMKTAKIIAIVGLTLTLIGSAVWADEGPARRGPESRPIRGEFRLDDRFHHDHYYPNHGMAVGALPRGALHVEHGGAHYYFHGGVWYRPVGSRFVVIAPPFGIVVPILPIDYVTLQIGGRPYFYANGTYYVTTPGVGYTVVEPPPNVDQAQGVPPPPAPMPSTPPSPVALAPAAAPITYPRNGQSAAQNAKDIEECNQWANTQPGVVGNAGVFQRAFAACMDGRGYTVR